MENLHHRIFQYVIAYDGPVNMSTVAGWLINQIQTNSWTPNQMVDMIIVLGKGVLWKISSFPELVISTATKANFWAYIDQTDKNLLSLFIHMLTWAAASSTPPNTLGYVSKVGFQNIRVL